jgi:hypothetical protein
MNPDLSEHLARLCSLAAREGHATAVARLRLSLKASRRSESRQHLIEAIPHVRLLPRSVRRLAWLEVFGSPARRRSRAVERVNELWKRGIGRSLDDLTTSSGAAELIAVCADPSIEATTDLLGSLARLDAFTTLVGDAGTEAWTAETIELALRSDPVECMAIEEGARRCGLPEIAEVASTARWIHAVRSPEAGQIPPPTGDLVRQVLLIPSLRGLRRSGARVHGRTMGRKVLEGIQSAARGATKVVEVSLPVCFRGEPPIRALLAPLVRDFLCKCVAEICGYRDRGEGVEILARNAPQLVIEAAAEIEPHALPPDAQEAFRTEWLAMAVGLAARKP